MSSSAAKVAVVTGANKGIGYFIARGLLLNGFHVVMACRDLDRARTAADKLLADKDVAKSVSDAKSNDAPVSTVRFDLEDPDSINEAAAEVKRRFPGGVDVVMHNAGFAFKTDATESIGEQAEKTVRINFTNTILATNAFLDAQKDGSRVVLTGSRAGYLSTIPGEETRKEFIRPGADYGSIVAHMKLFLELTKTEQHKASGWPDNTYGTSKCGLAAFARLAANDPRLTQRQITLNWFCPGWCRTDMAGDEAPRSPEEGADTGVWLATSDEVSGVTGRFYGERQVLDWENGSW